MSDQHNPYLSAEDLDRLRKRVQEVHADAETIQSGTVDAVVVDDAEGHHIYTLEGADYPYRVVLNTMHEGVVTVTAGRNIAYCNQRFSELCGLPCVNILGHSFERFVADEAIQLTDDLLDAALLEPQVAEVDLLTADGNRLPARFSVTAFAVDTLPMFSILITDLTEQKRSERELLEHQLRLRALAAELANAEQRERQRLASLIHDSVAQTLGGAKMHLQILQKNPQAAPIVPSLGEITLMIEEAVTQSRAIMTELSPPILREQGLVPTLKWWAGRLEQKHGLHITVTVEGPPQRFDPDAEATVFQMTKELLQNTLKHARATSASLTLKCSENHLDLAIADNGIGFDPDMVEHTEGGGFGLFSVRERVGYLGGEFTINSAPDQGTKAEIHLPLPCEISSSEQ